MKVYQYPYIDPDLSVWFPIIGTFFGGTLTLPWWLRLFGIPKKDENDKTRPQKRKEKRKGR